MMLRTIIACHSTQDDNAIKKEADKLRDTIRSFATNVCETAFWDAKSARAKKCIVVYGCWFEPEDAMQINCDDIEKVVTVWCNDIARDLYDRSGDDNRAKSYDVEISDLVWAGGMQIACLDDDEKQRYILWILPIRKGCK